MIMQQKHVTAKPVVIVWCSEMHNIPKTPDKIQSPLGSINSAITELISMKESY